MTSTVPSFEQIDFTDPDLLQRGGLPIAEFAARRATAPVWWNPQDVGKEFYGDDGFWVISRHSDSRAISKDADLWSSNLKGFNVRMPDEAGPEHLEASKSFLIGLDPPEHTRMRRIVSRLFTPRAVGALRGKLDAYARDVVTAAAESGTGNFVDDVAVHLPMRAILDLLGVPEADHQYLADLADAMANAEDPDIKYNPFTANANLLAYAHAMAEDRRKNPTDDIVTTLVQAAIDSHTLSELESGFLVILLVIAGTETARNATSHGINAFLDHPDQWELYKRERPPTTVEEIIRWATPVHAFQRTATRDTEVGGVRIERGQRAGLFYSSANYDDEVFDDPFSFDILRDPNPHLAFGGNGAHFCIGAGLARLELDLIFNALADIVPDITKLGAPVRVRSGWLHGVKRLPVSYR